MKTTTLWAAIILFAPFNSFAAEVAQSLQVAPGGPEVSLPLVTQAANYYGQERWPGSRILSITPYYAFDGTINAYAVQFAKKGSPLAGEADADKARATAEMRLDEVRYAWAMAMESEATETESTSRWQLRAAQNASVLPDDVGTVLIAARADLYPLLERHDGVAPHLKFKSKAQASARAEGINAAALGRTFYAGPMAYFHELAAPAKMNGLATGKVFNPMSEETFDLDQRKADGQMGRLSLAPPGKNAIAPKDFWDSFRAKGAPPNADANAPQVLPTNEVLGVPYYYQDDYGANCCVPNSTAQALGYWDDNGYGFFVDAGDSANGHGGELVYDLMRDMEYNYKKGTYWFDFIDGLAANISGYLTFDYPHGPDPFGFAKYLGYVSWGDIKGEIFSYRPFVYWNLDLNNYPNWKHSTTGVGYNETGGHILFLHYNYPPDTPFELNWDNINNDKEAMCKIFPDQSKMLDVVWSEDFEAGIWGPWKVESKGTAKGSWWPTGHRSRNNTKHPYPPNGNISKSAYCGGGHFKAPGPYPPNVSSWMTIGPFSTVGKSSGEVIAYIWRDIPDDPGDYVGILASTDGVDFAGMGYSGVAKSWTRHAFDLANFPGKGNLLNRPEVWVAIRFESDGDNIVGEGAYVDDFEIRLKPVSSVVVSSPEKGDLWIRKLTEKIEWHTVGDLGNGLVSLDLYSGGIVKTGIAINTPNDGEFDWTIPYWIPPQKNYRVRVTQSVGPVRSGMSEEFRILGDAAFNLTTPNGGEGWVVGTTKTVKWSWIGYPGTQVDLFLMKGGSTVRQIANDAPNNGSFTWAVPSDVALGVDYKVKIVGVNNKGLVEYQDESDAVFSMVQGIHITHPSDGLWWEKAQPQEIVWTSGTAPRGDVEIDLYRGRTIIPIVRSTPNTGRYLWMPGDIPSTDSYRIRIASLTDPGQSGFSDFFRVVEQPSLGVISPNGDEWWVRGSLQDITWVSSLAVKRPVRIDLYKAGVLHTTITSSTADTGSFRWVVPDSLPPDLDYRIRVALERNDTISDESDLDFAIVLPAVQITAPLGGELLRPATTQTIAWQTVGIDRADMRIELYRFTELESVISSATANTGEFVWTIPADQVSASDYSIKVWPVAAPQYEGMSGRFSIVEPPGIALLSPNGGESFLQSHRHPIEWTSRGIPDTDVLIELYEDDRPTSVATVSIFDTPFLWKVSHLIRPGSNYRIKITSLSNPLYSDISEAPFRIEFYAAAEGSRWVLY